MLTLCDMKFTKAFLVLALSTPVFAAGNNLPLPARIALDCVEILTHTKPYPTLYQKLYFAKEARRNGRQTGKHYESAMQSQFLSADQIEAQQVAALRKLTAYAQENVPFYRERFAEAGFDPASIRYRTDLLKIPTLTKKDLQENLEALQASGFKGKTITKMTTGSTGTPTTVRYSQDSEAWRQAMRIRGWGWNGYEIGAPTFIYWGAAVTPPKGLKALKVELDHSLKGEMYYDSLKQDEASLQKAVDLIRKFKPKAIVCMSQSCAEFAHWIVDNNKRDWHDIPVIAGAEAMYPADREIISQAFGSSVQETYGSREVMLMAAECPEHKGMHLSEENVLMEVTKDGNGNALIPDGRTGNVVVTDLNNYAMPLIRYENGDSAIMMPQQEKCPCGRGLRRLDKVAGRRADVLRAMDGSALPGIVFYQALTFTGTNAIRKFQVIQKRDGSVTVKIIRGKEFNEEVYQRQLGIAAAYLKGYPVNTEFVDEIPAAPGGKHHFVVLEK